LPFLDRQIVRWAIGLIAIPTLLGTILLKLHGVDFLPALLQSAGAICNSGITTRPLPSILSLPTFVVLLPLSVIGGLGLPVLMEIAETRKGRPLSNHAWTVLTFTAGLFILGSLMLFALGWPEIWDHTTLAISAAANAINARTAGFPIEYSVGAGRTSSWLVMLLMMIGAAPAGTAGGIKLTTIAQLHRGTNDLLDGNPIGRAMGIALTWRV
jgi:Trk-type K+ transport system membrane component